MEIAVRVVQLLLSLAILVIVHELGHFIAARIFKVRVERFYLFFNPWFSIFKFKYGDTTYGMGWVPLGGYVKIAGMVDESLDKEQLSKPPQPHEFRSKPAWQRLIIMVAGVSVNILLAFVIYISVLAVWGDEYLPVEEVRYGITVDSLGKSMGLRNGDMILAVNNKSAEDFFEIPAMILLEKAETITVIRDGQQVVVEVPDDIIPRILQERTPAFIGVRTPFTIETVMKDSPAKKAGLQSGDRIIGVSGQYLPFFDQFRTEVQQRRGETVEIMAIRNNDTLSIPVTVNAEGMIGVRPVQDMGEHFQLKEKHFSLLQAIPAGIVRGYEGVVNYLKQLRLIFSPQTRAYESLGGFITIGSIFPARWNWQAFWELTAFLSIMLAIINILPIPALDGGHVMFLLYEIISGRKPGDKFLEYAQLAGMFLLLALVIFANANDIRRLF